MNTELLFTRDMEGIGFKSKELSQRYFGFPEGLTFDEFKCLSPELRKQVILRNPILHTDAYNRTMEYVEGEDWSKDATYALQFRKAKEGYLIVAGIYDLCQKIADVRITQAELDFAKDYYENAQGINYFNADKWQYVIDQHDGKLPISIDSLKDGSAVLPGDPVLRVSGPNELIAHFEPYFHHIFYQTLVATNAHQITEQLGRDRFIEVGLRGAETEEKHLMAVKAMYIGGGITYTSSDLAAGYYPQFKLVGTMGHRFVQAYETEEQAFRKAIESLDAVTLLVDLNNSIQGIDLAIKLKKEYRASGKKIWIRLDSGNVSEQTLYALARQKEEGLTDPSLDKIIVEGVEHISDMVDIDRAVEKEGFDPKRFVMYGAGGLLISDDTQRCDASTGFKLTRIGKRPTIKFSDSTEKESIPGIPTLTVKDGKRFIAQAGEGEANRPLYFSAYYNKQLLIVDNIEGARINTLQSFELIRDAASKRQRTELSPKTKMLTNSLRNVTSINVASLAKGRGIYEGN